MSLVSRVVELQRANMHMWSISKLTAPKTVWCIIVLCIGIEVTLSAGDFGAFGIQRYRRLVYEYFGFWPGLLADWKPNNLAQPYTMFFTYGFLHNGVVHLFVNMVTLWSMGREVVRRVGPLKFLSVYFGAIVSGGLGYALLTEQFRPMVGASGALFGLIGALMAWNYVDRFTLKEGLWPIARAAVLLLVLNVALYWAMDGLMAWETHLGGFLGGWVIALLVDPRSRGYED